MGGKLRDPLLRGAGLWCPCPYVTCTRCPGAPGPTVASGTATGTGVSELSLAQSIASRILFVLSALGLLYPEGQGDCPSLEVGAGGGWLPHLHFWVTALGEGSVNSQHDSVGSWPLETEVTGHSDLTGLLFPHLPPQTLTPALQDQLSNKHPPKRRGVCPALV